MPVVQRQLYAAKTVPNKAQYEFAITGPYFYVTRTIYLYRNSPSLRSKTTASFFFRIFTLLAEPVTLTVRKTKEAFQGFPTRRCGLERTVMAPPWLGGTTRDGRKPASLSVPGLAAPPTYTALYGAAGNKVLCGAPAHVHKNDVCAWVFALQRYCFVLDVCPSCFGLCQLLRPAFGRCWEF